MLHIFVNKDLKNFKERKDLEVWFRKCQEIETKTPKSFELLSKKLGFCEKSCICQLIKFLPLKIMKE